MYILQLMDNYVSSWSVFLMAGLESVTIGWIYGELNFKKKSILKLKKKRNFVHMMRKIHLFCIYGVDDYQMIFFDFDQVGIDSSATLKWWLESKEMLSTIFSNYFGNSFHPWLLQYVWFTLFNVFNVFILYNVVIV